jgi:hypothetical protein
VPRRAVMASVDLRGSAEHGRCNVAWNAVEPDAITRGNHRHRLFVHRWLRQRADAGGPACIAGARVPDRRRRRHAAARDLQRDLRRRGMQTARQVRVLPRAVRHALCSRARSPLTCARSGIQYLAKDVNGLRAFPGGERRLGHSEKQVLSASNCAAHGSTAKAPKKSSQSQFAGSAETAAVQTLMALLAARHLGSWSRMNAI